MYLQWFGVGLYSIYDPANAPTTLWGLSGLSGSAAAHQTTWMGIVGVTLALVLAAAAQLDFAAQKKVLQYLMAGTFLQIYGIHKFSGSEFRSNGGEEIGYAVCTVNIALCVVACYVMAPAVREKQG
eukprot:CAMPEP_0205827210 /NCGR_PEP_ID=MMETSP0206-20130828/31248_1 /ASSEMBLY_ACC=CAM_ASM_000279 /TAXON_ID=36767 /ORGANISM="Euplotes focardii, Strain TN1" /LENGTH=125 /DNA_ID=CAMNT_0053127897 /DNA_START=51 /DNA_END=428 /DNA_ORIENTATION=-